MRPSPQWEALKQEARRCEKELGKKLHELGRVLGDERTEDPRPRLVKLVEALLGQMEAAVDAMEKQVEGSAQRQHAVGRTRAICDDYRAEFQRTKRAVDAAMSRRSLLAPADRHRETHASEVDALLREESSLHSAVRGTDQLIDVASATGASLAAQRSIFASSKHKTTSIAGQMPSLSGIIRQIKRYKQRDTLVLALVVGLCLFLTLLYWWNK